MAKFIIEGGYPLQGEIAVSGAKNAATPIIAATLLTKERCVINNIPQISDVRRMLDILKSLGAEVEWIGEHAVNICCRDVEVKNIDRKLVKSMRSSILLLGPILSRFDSVKLPEPGGCIIGKRSIDTHVSALENFGVKITQDKDGYTFKRKGALKGKTIVLPEFSVTATENLMMAAVAAEGTTVIKLAAAEPHVQDLANFLNKIGAKISGAGTHTITIEGVDKFKGAKHTVMPDQIEIGTFAVMAAVARGKITIKNIIPGHLEIILLKLKEIGVDFQIEGNCLKVGHSPSLKAFKLQALPYPGFPTDLQAPFSVLATQCQGTSLIQDPLYEGRMGHVNELIKMGANAIIADPHRVIITGPTPLYGQEIKSFDIRAGATLVIAGLIAKGQTIINEAEMVDRGYEKIEERLTKLGAHITRIES